MTRVPPESLAMAQARILDLEAELARIQRLPDLTWAQVTAGLMQRFSRLSREGDRDEAKALVALIDKAKVYVARILAERDRVIACNEEMREPMRRLRELMCLPAQGEEWVVDEVVREMTQWRKESYAHPLPIVGCTCGACEYERRKQREAWRDGGVVADLAPAGEPR